MLSVVFSYLVGCIQRAFPREEARIQLLLGEAASRQLDFPLCYVLLWPHYSCNSTKVKSLGTSKQQ